MVGQIFDVHWADSITLPAACTAAFFINQAQGRDLVKRNQDRSQGTEIFAPDAPVQEGCKYKSDQNAP